MLQPSQRGVALPASPYRKLSPYADAARQRGIIVHPLNIGQPDIETPPAMLAAVQNADIRVLEYGPTAGTVSYRQKLATYYQNLGLDVTAEDILVTTGGSESISFALLACLNPGDEFIVPEPFYGPYNAFAISTGTHVVAVASHLENDFALPPVEEFERKITPRTKAILICSPNNPTGYVYSRQELEQIKDLCVRHNLFLLSDEAYREFCYDATFTSALHLQGADDHVVLLDTISKRYSACGARIGALVTKNKTLRDIVFKLAQLRVCPPGLGQLLAEAAADLPEDYFDHTKAEYLARRNLMVSRLRAMPGVRCPLPRGAFYVLCHLPIDDADLFAKWLLEKFSYRNETLMVSPASGFYATPSLGRQQMRMAYVVNQDVINRAMDCLEVALREYPGRSH
ncbi:pyridoxal phosphate-dependent aminotransferase [Hymenobacter taeanensis]|uniref:Pyridoxal phosphate-dependent aminotransferase n=1 Tax=Hymenobacter taeanensis TaxID=2735321 RepID=A0A6M6BJW6_9BACT|nr:MULTISPECIES: pyridoxal phosphate-dependent aminotransferase [Hymenobacter]QJX47365.1 pyridoxal phosphate-dependent aminotransferase [Hymenobacter taeanensis]UOQ79296.1 pyridoxal phosphate-dependent aminotransferase [Hymenobacter sp. 5414T-23]